MLLINCDRNKNFPLFSLEYTKNASMRIDSKLITQLRMRENFISNLLQNIFSKSGRND